MTMGDDGDVADEVISADTSIGGVGIAPTVLLGGANAILLALQADGRVTTPEAVARFAYVLQGLVVAERRRAATLSEGAGTTADSTVPAML